MGGAVNWMDFALDTVSSQWKFHMDLLEMWRNELGSISLSAFVMRASEDAATFAAQLNYYDQILRLFAFDTGFEPLVSIYDGEIRSDQVLYNFFSSDPVYRRVSGAYYSAKQEDIWEQFTDQFVGNFCLIWGLFFPNMTAHALASAPEDLFKSRANKILTKRFTELGQAGDFFKWASHAYSTSFKNYSPFIISPEMWRVYNPLIDLYYLTLASHIRCLSALRAIAPPGLIKPFIETQRVKVTVNDEPFDVARLEGDGMIQEHIPEAALTKSLNIVKFNTYGQVLEVPILNGWIDNFVTTSLWGSYDYDLHYDVVLFGAEGPPYQMHMCRDWLGAFVFFGVDFGFTDYVNVAVTIDYEVTSELPEDTWVFIGGWEPGAGFYAEDSVVITGPGSTTFHVPPRRYWGVGLYGDSFQSNERCRDLIIKKITITPEDIQPLDSYAPQWKYRPEYDRRTNQFHPIWPGWPEDPEPEW